MTSKTICTIKHTAASRVRQTTKKKHDAASALKCGVGSSVRKGAGEKEEAQNVFLSLAPPPPLGCLLCVSRWPIARKASLPCLALSPFLVASHIYGWVGQDNDKHCAAAFESATAIYNSLRHCFLFVLPPEWVVVIGATSFPVGWVINWCIILFFLFVQVKHTHTPGWTSVWRQMRISCGTNIWWTKLFVSCGGVKECVFCFVGLPKLAKRSLHIRTLGHRIYCRQRQHPSSMTDTVRRCRSTHGY